MAQDDCIFFASTFVAFICFIAYMVSSAVLLETGLKAWDVDHLDTSCVIGDVYDILNASSSGPKYNARMRVRYDGGLLYAKAILGDGASDDDAMALIRSEATTLANWTSLVTGGNLTMTGPASELLVWVYPSNEMASSGLPSFSVSGTLPDAALGKGVNASDIEYYKTGTDYCNVPGAEDNVWYETKSWFPVAVLRMAQAGVVITSTSVAIVCLFFAVVRSGSSRLPTLVGLCCWSSLILPVAAFYAVGSIGAVAWERREDIGWEHSYLSTAHRQNRRSILQVFARMDSLALLCLSLCCTASCAGCTSASCWTDSAWADGSARRDWMPAVLTPIMATMAGVHFLVVDQEARWTGNVGVGEEAATASGGFEDDDAPLRRAPEPP